MAKSYVLTYDRSTCQNLRNNHSSMKFWIQFGRGKSKKSHEKSFVLVKDGIGREGGETNQISAGWTLRDRERQKWRGKMKNRVERYFGPFLDQNRICQTFALSVSFFQDIPLRGLVHQISHRNSTALTSFFARKVTIV